MTNRPKISVLVSCYNAAPHLREAIQSILAQTCQDFELIIVDDGSTDSSLSIIREFAAHDSRIVVISRVNRGLVKSLNEGIAMASGKYIARMDADDIAHPERLQKQFLFMEQNPQVDICGAWAKTIEAQPKTIKHPCRHNEIQAMLFFRTAFVHPTIFFRAQSLQQKNIYYLDGCAEDYDLFCRISPWASMANIPEYLLEYRKHPDQITTTKSAAVFESSALIRQRNAEDLLGRQLMAAEAAILYRFSNSRPGDLALVDALNFMVALARKNRLLSRYPAFYFELLLMGVFSKILGHSHVHNRLGFVALSRALCAFLVCFGSKKSIPIFLKSYRCLRKVSSGRRSRE